MARPTTTPAPASTDEEIDDTKIMDLKRLYLYCVIMISYQLSSRRCPYCVIVFFPQGMNACMWPVVAKILAQLVGVMGLIRWDNKMGILTSSSFRVSLD